MFQLEHVDAGYGDSTVLRDVTLTVPQGTIVALLGPNGAGKTTLLRVASGLMAPFAGDVRFDGMTMNGKGADAFARAGICLVPEGRGIFRSMSVRDNLLLNAVTGDEAAALDRAIEVFPRLGQRLNQRAGTLSGGEQQMLAVSRAYLAEPSLVLLDEVSLGLAPLIIDEIFDFLAKLREQGTSLLLVEQYIARALSVADFVYLLNHGQVVFAGEAHEVDQGEIYRTYTGTTVPV